MTECQIDQFPVTAFCWFMGIMTGIVMGEYLARKRKPDISSTGSEERK